MAADNTAMSKDVRRDQHLSHSVRKLNCQKKYQNQLSEILPTVYGSGTFAKNRELTLYSFHVSVDYYPIIIFARYN